MICREPCNVKERTLIMEMRKLTTKDYDELLELLNHTFANKYGRDMDFLNEQPKMWVKDDEHMGNHVGVFEDGRLVSVVGIYPLPAKIDGTDILFATTGNVATHPEYEGRGYFSKAFSEIMTELEKIDADAARLGGARQRYGRYGFEPGGLLHKFTINSTNFKKCYKKEPNVTFRPVALGDACELKFIKELSERSLMFVKRSTDDSYRDVFLALSSKHSRPYIAERDGKPIGYLSAYADNQFVGVSDFGRHIAEIRGNTPDDVYDMVMCWQNLIDKEVDLPVSPFETELLRIFSKIAEGHSAVSPSHFKFRKFEPTADALMRVKAKTVELPEGEFTLEIKDYGNLCFYNKGGKAGCEKTSISTALTLERSDAQRLLFGSLPTEAVCDLPWIARAFLPLPLTWNTNDYT